MRLKEIYRPVEAELAGVEHVLKDSLRGSRHKSIFDIGNYVLRGGGKRLRPAMVLLSAKACQGRKRAVDKSIISIAAAMELIHTASLIHDDVMDHSLIRHNRSTVNSKWADDVSIAFGDHIYSVAFELISTYGSRDILGCISSATKGMCEGELLQICERDNPNMLKERYIIIVKKKTASLFAASCGVGAMSTNNDPAIQRALEGYGLNFGIAFQIIDDCLDLIGDEEDMGKAPGADFKMGELTLPVLNLVSQYEERKKITGLIRQKDKKCAFDEIKEQFINSQALPKTKEDISFYIRKAKQNLNRLEDSSFKRSLFALADYIIDRMNI